MFRLLHMELTSITIQHCAVSRGKTFEGSRDVVHDAVGVGDKGETTRPF